MRGIARYLPRALAIAAVGGVALAQGGEAMARPDRPIWASNTQQSSEHCAQQATLTPGNELSRGSRLTSRNGKYFLAMQDDGNLVLYRATGAPLWATGTHGQSIRHAVMQGDGNLVLYNYAGQPRWASNTAGNPGAYLVVQCDGNLVIYVP